MNLLTKTSKNKIAGFLINNSENLLVSIILAAVLIIPVFTSSSEQKTLNDIFRTWRMLWPFFAIFIINHFVLMPKLLFNGKIKTYTAAITMVIAVFGIWQIMQSPAFPHDNTTPVATDWRILLEGPPPKMEDMPEKMHENPPCPPHEMFNDMPNDRFQPDDHPFPRFHDRRPSKLVMVLSMVLTAALLVGFDIGLRLAFRMGKIQYQNAILEKQISEKNLSSLKNQVSPHFFMNTLNNIHALVDIDPQMAQDAIIKLSKLMRYLLYECGNNNKVQLSKEFEFAGSYIELMKMRFSNKVKISYIYPENPPDKNVAPLMFISLIENAFKHGISYTTDSFVDVTFKIENQKLLFSCINSIAPKEKTLNATKKQGGIGIANTRKQLDLIYSNNYDFKIDASNNKFSVFLTIPLS